MNVVFDIGGVLLDWSPVRLLQQQGWDLSLAEPLFKHERWYRLDAGLVTRDQYEQETAAALSLELRALRALLDAMPHSLEPVEPVVALARQLKAAGSPMFVLSNMPDYVSVVLMAKHDFLSLPNECVFSFEARVNKPDPQIYRHFSERCGLAGPDCFFIDDSLPNLREAQAQGWQVAHLPDTSPGSIERLVQTLDGLGLPVA